MADRAGKTYYVTYKVDIFVPVIVVAADEETERHAARHYSEQILRHELGKWNVQSIGYECAEIVADDDRKKP